MQHGAHLASFWSPVSSFDDIVPPDYLEKSKMGSDLLQGTVELMVLKALSLEPMHGWGIGQRLDQTSGEVFKLPHGSLYPALQRMLRKGSIRSEWRTTENNRRARYYIITPAGRRQLEAEIRSWRRASAALNEILSQ
jgi:transcriptional regulator